MVVGAFFGEGAAENNRYASMIPYSPSLWLKSLTDEGL
jgi:hypothetical protein